MNASKCRCVI